MKTEKTLALYLIILVASIFIICLVNHTIYFTSNPFSDKGKVTQEVTRTRITCHDEEKYTLTTWIEYNSAPELFSVVKGSATKIANIKEGKYKEAESELNLLILLNQPVK